VTYIPPRLNRILTLLLEENAPLSVDRLAKELGVGRRTVFRELESADAVLESTGLLLNTIPGQGMTLAGGGAAKAALKERLGGAAAVRPKNKSDRRTFLTLLLLDAGEMQKLYTFAKALDVSEATVSGDLDKLEPFFSAHNLRLVRRQSQGIEVIGGEADIRRALADVAGGTDFSLASFSKNFGYPSAHVLQAVGGALEGEWLPKLDWMTGESLEMLKTRLVVMAERVLRRRMLDGENDPAAGLPKQLAEQLCDTLENLFSIRLPEPERASVGAFIRASRAKQIGPQIGSLNVNDAAAYVRVQNLAYRMIDAFDPKLSHSLKLNEDLVRGLSLHLWGAAVRLKQGIRLHSAMQEQLSRNFPEVYAKSRQAAKVLEQEYGGAPAPESEVAFISSHFGAALMHYGERSNRRVVLKAGIVCVAGVGVSYMMASQVRKKFRGQLEVVVSDWNSPEEWANFDLLISSIPLEHEACPVVVVNAILEPADYEAIGAAVENHEAAAKDAMPRLSGGLPQRLEKAAARFAEMAVMLRGFCGQTIHADCGFDELAKMAGYRFGSRPESGGRIYRDLKKREAVSTQVIAQLGIVLLHARTPGVQQSAIGLITPEGLRFTDPYFQGARGCIVMLVPERSDKDLLEIFGYISGALVEDEVLLAAVQTGDEPVAYTRIEAAMLQYLKDYWNEKLDV
jgi:mannitol operon transcriptional antiterminator